MIQIQNIKNPALHALMDKYDACPESRSWLGDRDMATALAECPNINWIFWLAARMLSRKQFVLLVVAVVQPAMQFVSDDDDRPQACLNLLTAWANGKATLYDVQSAANAAADLDVSAASRVATYTAANAANAAADYANAATAFAATATVHAANAATAAAANAAAAAADHAAYDAAVANAAAAAADYASIAAYHANTAAHYANGARIEMLNIIRDYIEIV